MIKRFAYIVLLLIFASCLASAISIKNNRTPFFSVNNKLYLPAHNIVKGDTTLTKKTKQQQEEDKKKIKEIAKAKRQAKPEKIDDKAQPATKAKSKRERRPEGLERPPEIPRRSGN